MDLIYNYGAIHTKRFEERVVKPRKLKICLLIKNQEGSSQDLKSSKKKSQKKAQGVVAFLLRSKGKSILYQFLLLEYIRTKHGV